MQKVSRFLLITSIFFICLIFSGCKNSSVISSYDEMLQIYNSKYFSLTPTDPIEKKITDPGFTQESMLENRYTLIQGYETPLVAPMGGARYLWQKQNDDGTYVEPALCQERVYSFIPEDDFELNAETKLVLTVTNEAGTEYIDTTIIIVLNRE